MNVSKGFIYTFLSAFAWAVSIVLLRLILQSGEDSYNVLFWSSLLALPYWIYLFLKQKEEVKKLSKKDVRILLWIGLISAVGVSLTEILALKYSPAINYSFLIRTVIIFTFVFAYFFLGEKLTKKKIILAFLLLTGAYFLTTKGEILSLTTGDIFTLIEAALIALGNNVLGKIATNSMSTALSASATVLIGFIPKALISIYFTSLVLPSGLFLIFVLTLVYIALTNLRFEAYKNASASYVTMVFSFTPVFVSFMAIPLLNESMTTIQIVGGLLIIAAGVMVEKLKI